ncbi:hypothetical protein MBLNU459_g1624t2 [Dothideomycetes sp. NU459]
MAHLADALKEKGNQLFKEGDYAGAEAQYTAAITKYSRNHLLFNNRAFARIRLQRWEGVIDDCLHSIELTGGQGYNFKAYFYLAQAQLALNHPNEALASALTAYNQVLHPPPAETAKATSNLSTVSAFVLTCKRAKFAARERERLRRRGDLLAELEETLEQATQASLSTVGAALAAGAMGVVEAHEQREELLAANRHKVDELRSVFAVADPRNCTPREVPDHLVDTITFEIMHDPVVTRTGHSYERATLCQHLKRSPTDPLTREPLTVADLRPNVALRQVLEEFWRTAGNWAIEW